MHTLALSATSTTGLFTILGTLVGAIIGGTLTILIEILRRRWQREDAKDRGISDQREERKILYHEFVDKGIELDFFTANKIFEKNPQTLTSKGRQGMTWSESEAAQAFTLMWPSVATTLREFKSLSARIDMIAGDAVKRHSEDWYHYLLQSIILASNGIGLPKDETNRDPGDLLLNAMRAELQDLTFAIGKIKTAEVSLTSRLS